SRAEPQLARGLYPDRHCPRPLVNVPASDLPALRPENLGEQTLGLLHPSGHLLRVVANRRSTDRADADSSSYPGVKATSPRQPATRGSCEGAPRSAPSRQGASLGRRGGSGGPGPRCHERAEIPFLSESPMVVRSPRP